MNVWDLLLNSKDVREEEDEENIKRTCIWLREAGFPQYVQMYNEGEFPISLKLVQEDHCKFDGESLMALFRRIEILNKSAEIKSETRITEFTSTTKETVTVLNKPRKYEIIEDDSSSSNSEEDEEDDEYDDKENVLEQTALSSNWLYEHRTRRWSHIEPIKSQVDVAPGNSSPTLQQYLGVALPRPFVSKPNDKQKRPTTLTTDNRPSFEPIPEICDPDAPQNNHSSEMSNSDKDTRFSTSLSSDSRESGDCLSPTSPDGPIRDKSSHILRSTSLKLIKAVSRLSPHQMSFKNHKRGRHDPNETRKNPVIDHYDPGKSDNVTDVEQLRNLKLKDDIGGHNIQSSDRPNKLTNESFHAGDAGWINARTGSFISRASNQFDEDGKKPGNNVTCNLDPIISLLESDVDSLDVMRSKIKMRSSSGSAPNSPVLRKKPSESPDVDKSSQRLSDLEGYTRLTHKSNIHSNNIDKTGNRISTPVTIIPEPDSESSKHLNISPKISRNSATRWSHTSYRNGKEKAPKLYKLIEFSVTQMSILKKLSVLGCTSMLEKYCPSQKNVFNWRLPRLLPQKQRINLEETVKVFGVNLSICQIRFGQPYPPAILNVFQYLREQGPSSEGIFRKAGMKARSKALRAEIELNPNFNKFDDYSVFDVADVLKGFLRDLPDRLLTSKLSATLMAIYSYVPKEQQVEGLRLALLSLPDENRTALEILIEFLSFLSSHSKVTMMDVSNLSLLFCPNLFNFPTDSNPNNSIGALRMKKSNGPNVKLLAEQNSAHLCIMDMILNLDTIFQVTDETLKKNHSKMYYAEPKDISHLLSTGLWQEWLCDKFSQLKADTVNHKSGWINVSKDSIRKLHGADSLVEQLSFRKIGSQNDNADGIALRTWKVVIDVDVSPGYLFTNIKDKRHHWDPSITTTESLQEMNDYVDLVRLTSCNPDGSSVPRLFNLLRGHQLGLGGSSHIIVSESVNIQHIMTVPDSDSGTSTDSLLSRSDQCAQATAVVGQVFCDHFMIEACSTRTTRVTWISRVDLRGHHSDWYSSHWGHDLIKRASSLKRFSEASVVSGDGSTVSPGVCVPPVIEEPTRETVL